MLHLLHDVGVGEGGRGVVAIRCGRMGSCIGTREGGIRWIPAYFEGEEQDRVVDVSGGKYAHADSADGQADELQPVMLSWEDMWLVYTCQVMTRTKVRNSYQSSGRRISC